MQEYPRGGFANGEVLNEGLEHLPCVVLLDTSGSMAGCIGELNDALAMFKADLESDVNTRAKTEVCLITFDDSVRIVAPFSAVRDLSVPVLTAGGCTVLHEAIDVAIEEIDARRKQYKSLETLSYKPFIFLMTDGVPTDIDTGQIARIKQLQASKEDGGDGWTFFPLALGAYADREFLKSLNRNGVVLTADPGVFKGVFKWIKDSLSKISASRRDDTVSPDNPNNYGMGWEQVTINA